MADPFDQYLRNIGAEPEPGDPKCSNCGYDTREGMVILDTPLEQSQQNQFEQQPFVPEATDDQIIGLARSIHCDNETQIEANDGVLVSRGEDGAWVDAIVFVPRAEIEEQFGAYVPDGGETEVSYEPGPVLTDMMEQARGSFVEDIRRGCNMAMMDNANYKAPLWERIATSVFALLCACAIGYYVGEGSGYKKGVADTFAATISILKHINDEPDGKVQQ